MSDKSNASGPRHSDSDRALDKAATAEHKEQSRAADASAGASATHDPAEIRKHDDAGKDRLFEGRQQHDEAEKNSEKTRLAKDVAKHHHGTDDDVADAGTPPSAKRKS